MSEYKPSIKKFRKNKFTQLSNVLVDDGSISAKSKGIFMYLWSKPDDWKFWNKDIIKHCTEGKDAVLSGIRELEDKGYIVRVQNSDLGAHDGYSYYLSDEPDFLKEELNKELVPTEGDNQGVGGKSSQGVGGKSSNRQEDYPPYSNTKSTNTNIVEDESSSIKEKVGDREGIELADRFIKHLLAMKPDMKVESNRNSFQDGFALMIRVDNRDMKEICGVMDWLSSGSKQANFWSGNILSGKKFRIKFDKLQIDMNADGFIPNSGNISKDILKQYLIDNFGRSRTFFNFTKDNKRIQVAFVGEYYTFANFNTGEMFNSKQQAWIWETLIIHSDKLFPKLKG